VAKVGLGVLVVFQEARGLAKGLGKRIVVSAMGTPCVAYLRDLVVAMTKAVLADLA
jgi:hypothetical protein